MGAILRGLKQLLCFTCMAFSWQTKRARFEPALFCFYCLGRRYRVQGAEVSATEKGKRRKVLAIFFVSVPWSGGCECCLGVVWCGVVWYAEVWCGAVW